MAERKTSRPPRTATDYSIIFQKTSQTIAGYAGDPFYANLSPAGVQFSLDSQLHRSEFAVKNIIKEELLKQFLKDHGTFGGYNNDTMPLAIRHTLKERLYKDMERDNAGYVIINRLLTLDENERKHTRRTVASLFTLNDYAEKLGLMRYLGVTPQQRTETLAFKPSNPEVQRFLKYKDEDYLNTFISGLPGTGKTNVAIMLTDMIVKENYGYLNPEYGLGQTKVSVYFPNYTWAQGTAFKYRHVWDIFKETSPGSSILWKKYQYSKYSEESHNNAMDVFAVLYLGEVGAGKLVWTQSRTTVAYKEFFSQIRQLRIRPILSSAQTISKELMIELINPQIVVESDPVTGHRTAEAQYIDTSGENVTKIKLGRVDLHPLTEKLGKGIASDFSEDMEHFSVKKMYSRTHVTDLDMYMKDPDKVIQEASDWVFKWEEENEFNEESAKPEESPTEQPDVAVRKVEIEDSSENKIDF